MRLTLATGILLLLEASISASASSVVDGLEPAAVWDHFSAIASIPHQSGHLDGIRDYLKEFAEGNGLEWAEDDAGNILIKRPGISAGQGATPVILQSHMDMVAAKDPGYTHDFDTDPLTLILDGDWLHANGTTLGADDGIGMAIALAVLEEAEGPGGAVLPPVEALFTVDEETTMSGAWGVNGSMLAGRNIINIDSETLGDVIVGSAGGFQAYITLDAGTQEEPKGFVPVLLEVTGLLGGHSGMTISDDRGNAIKMCASVLSSMLANNSQVCFVGTDDGTAMNAIPDKCQALLAAPQSALPDLAAIASQAQSDYLLEYGTNEPNITITARPLREVNATAAEEWEQGGLCLMRDDAQRLIGLLLSIYHGVYKYSLTMEGLPETSNGLDMVTPSWDNTTRRISHTVVNYPRSSIEPELPRLLDTFQRLGAAFGAAKFERSEHINPAWTFDPSAALTNITAQVTTEVTGAANVAALHAGLEVAILLDKLPAGASGVSVGPTLLDVHTPKERLDVTTVQPVYDIVLGVLGALALEDYWYDIIRDRA